jgi:hypothetical protein
VRKRDSSHCRFLSSLATNSFTSGMTWKLHRVEPVRNWNREVTIETQSTKAVLVSVPAGADFEVRSGLTDGIKRGL